MDSTEIIWLIIGIVIAIFLCVIGWQLMKKYKNDKKVAIGGSQGVYFGGKRHSRGGHFSTHTMYQNPDQVTAFGGDPEGLIYGGASTSNLLLLRKSNGGEYKVLLGQLKEHGNNLQLPGGFVDGEEDMEKAALRGASGMTGQDFVSAYYGKGMAKTALYKDTPETKRANVVLVVDKEPKLNDYEQNDELDPGFSKDKTRTKWVSVKDIQSSSTIKSDKNGCVKVPFYIKRSIGEAIKNLK